VHTLTDTTAELDARTHQGNDDGRDLTESYTTRFTVDQTAREAYDAINNVRGWWSENIDGTTDVVGAEWEYHNEPVHYSRIKVIDLDPGKRVVWRVLDNRLSFVDDTTEWIGNEMVFEITTADGKTEVVFTQLGLVPEYECYDICKNAWGGYIKASLRSLISTGKGAPVMKFA
jgi:activator of Hsp90 ATPase-like protein